MPYLWLHHKVAVEVEELVPTFWNVLSSLRSEIHRYRDKPYGIKKLQSGGNGRRLLIDFDTLPAGIQEALGDPRKYGHLLEKYYQSLPSNAFGGDARMARSWGRNPVSELRNAVSFGRKRTKRTQISHLFSHLASAIVWVFAKFQTLETDLSKTARR